MKKTMIVLAVVVSGAPQLSAQVAQRVQRAPDGVLRMTYASRPEVCGDGTFIGEDTPRGFRMYSFHQGGGYNVQTLEDVQPECTAGPVRLVVTKAGGRVTDLNAAVGVNWRSRSNATDLGSVSAPEVAAWLIDLAQDARAEDQVLTVAFVAANAADSARLAERLLVMVRNRALGSDLRSRALRWAAEAARREGRGDEADRTIRAILRDETDATTVRDRAIRELDVTASNDAFLRESFRIVREPALRERILRSVAASKTEQNASWIREIVNDQDEDRRQRDRALRALVEQKGHQEARALFVSLTDTELKDRALRLAVENGDADGMQWLREIALDARQANEVRDRAIRLMSEQRATSAELASLYDRVAVTALQQRITRLLAERADDAAVEKLIQIAERDPDPNQRRYVLKRLAESRHPRAKTFLESRVVR